MEKLIFYNSIPSTNAEARRLAEEGAPHGTAVLAAAQTAGRGRMGRSFLSPEGGLYLSVILRPEKPAAELMHLTAMLAVGACNAVEAVCGVRPKVKWVNDLILGGKKVAGILVEPKLGADGRMEYAICGIGINCNTDLQSLTPEVREIATALQAELGQPADISALAAAVVRQWTDLDENWLEIYRRDCVTLRKTVRVLGAEAYTAQAVDVTEDGALLVQTEAGTLRKVFTGEVSVRGLGGYV